MGPGGRPPGPIRRSWLTVPRAPCQPGPSRSRGLHPLPANASRRVLEGDPPLAEAVADLVGLLELAGLPRCLAVGDRFPDIGAGRKRPIGVGASRMLPSPWEMRS